MLIISSQEAKEIDSHLQSNLGIPSIVLMENAGEDVFLESLRLIKEFELSKIFVFAGVGNNGGDGLVTARKLISKNFDTVIFLVGDIARITDNTKTNLNILKHLTSNIFRIFSEDKKIYFGRLEDNNFQEIDELEKVLNSFLSFKLLVVDALLGVGIKRKINTPFLEVINYINRLKSMGAKVISVDTPSGYYPSNDREELNNQDAVVNADVTVSFFGIKEGMFYPESKVKTGKIIISNLGLNEKVILSGTKRRIRLVTDGFLLPFPVKSQESHKGSYGRVFIIGGSSKYLGAQIISSKASTRTGVGYTFSIVLEKYNSIFKSQAPEIISIPLPSGHRDTLSPSDAKFILESNIIKEKDVIVLGNGMDKTEETKEFTLYLLENLKENIFVIDADGINVLSEDLGKIKSLLEKRVVMTPHILEFSRMLKEMPKNVKVRPFSLGKEFSENYGINLVLKDNIIFLFFEDGEIYISDLGRQVLAKSGSGDILSGLIGGFIALTKDIKQGTILGVQAFGLASQKVQEELGTLYPTSIHIIDALSKILH